jgi:FkbM family methyltransferase
MGEQGIIFREGRLMGLIGNYFNRKVKQIFSAEFYTYQKLILRYLFNNRKGVFKTRIRGNKIVANDTKALLGMFREIYLQRQYHFTSENKSPVIIDCGANIGIATLYFKKMYPASKIICIEADPSVAELLKKNITQNNIQNTEVIVAAAWNSTGETLEFGSAGADAGSLFSSENKIKVPTTRLRDLILEKGKIDLLKMDIEGAETIVLEDCAGHLQMVERIFVEYHSYTGQKQDLDRLLQILSNGGFRYFMIPVRRIDTPFDFDFSNESMDLQMNIFAYRS